jgi:hypothetical protein
LVLKERTPEGRPVTSTAWPAGARCWRGEEEGGVVASIAAREDAGEDTPREEVGKLKVVAVDDVAPRAADSPGLGERTARQAAEDVEENVVGEAEAAAVRLVHDLAGRRWCGSRGRWTGEEIRRPPIEPES